MKGSDHKGKRRTQTAWNWEQKGLCSPLHSVFSLNQVFCFHVGRTIKASGGDGTLNAPVSKIPIDHSSKATLLMVGIGIDDRLPSGQSCATGFSASHLIVRYGQTFLTQLGILFHTSTNFTRPTSIVSTHWVVKGTNFTGLCKAVIIQVFFLLSWLMGLSESDPSFSSYNCFFSWVPFCPSNGLWMRLVCFEPDQNESDKFD
jgi:hypothetical protein